MPTLPVDTDVLIVGAGPTGLTLAASLAQLGVEHVLIDRDTGAHVGSKAAGVQPRTLEYLDRLGIAGALVADGLRGDGFRVQDGGRVLLRVSYARLDTPFPFLLAISQRVTEAHLERRVTELGGTIHRGHRLLSWQTTFPGVTAVVAGPDGVLRAVQARYLVGCDGVHSAVRASAGIPFPGGAPEQLFTLADVRLKHGPSSSATDETTFFVAGNGLLLTVPLPGGLHRIAASVPAGIRPPSASELDALLASRAGRGTFRRRVGEVMTASTYRVQERVAARLSDGPVFLAGDAAHTHSPAGGQGMNTGIQDAANLAWKLHEVIAAGAPAELLETYHRERHPVATAVVAFTSRMTALATLTDPALCELRNEVAAAAATPAATGWLATRLAQLDVDYAAARTPAFPRAGRRVAPTAIPAAGLSWLLAVPAPAGGPAPDGQLERLAVRATDAPGTTLLIRPDGHLAADGVPDDAGAVQRGLGDYALGVDPAGRSRSTERPRRSTPRRPAGSSAASRARSSPR